MRDSDLILKLLQINATAAFNRWAGLEIVSAAPGEVEIRMPWRDELGQYQGFLHAGVIAALLDTACGYAAFTKAGLVLTSHFSINCLSPAVGKTFFAHGKIVKVGKRQIFTRAELFAANEKDERKCVASGEALLLATDTMSPPHLVTTDRA